MQLSISGQKNKLKSEWCSVIGHIVLCTQRKLADLAEVNQICSQLKIMSTTMIRLEPGTEGNEKRSGYGIHGDKNT